MRSPSSVPIHRYVYHFESFIRKNAFNTQCPSYATEIRLLLGTETATDSHLVQAMLAVGALEASRSSAIKPADMSDHRSDVYSALISIKDPSYVDDTATGTIRVRIGDLFRRFDAEDVSKKASVLALEGHNLQRTLKIWRGMNLELLDAPAAFPVPYSKDHTGLLASAFFPAINIYLSGVYDYSAISWKNCGIDVPIIFREDVQGHVTTILRSTSLAWKRTNISHLLYLFPLRVAGARCKDKWHRDQIVALLRGVGTTFVVAQSFEMELSMLWGQDNNVTSV
ncbi:hypothetical protein SUNI508_06659 [Seiridium unicorne]|uniref:Uncharacterized protein n=1 Tax=Seiridium unicorne TaxID=138068 RepID=A0ABR2V0U5_9PEZI